MPTDLELFTQYRAGSQTAFAELVARHVDWVYSAARRRVGDAQLAEDVTQAVFLALASRQRPMEDAMIAPWLFRVMRYTSAKVIRSESRRHRHEAAAARQRTETEDAASPWIALAPLLDEAVAQLGQGDRQAVLLRFYQRRSLADVGQLLGLTEEGARKRVARAIAKLRKWMGSPSVALSAGALSELLLENCTHRAPAAMGASIGSSLPASSAARQLFRAWQRQGLFQLLGTAAAAAIALAALGITIAQIAPTSRHPVAATQGNAAPASQPTTQPEAPTFATDVTFDQLIAAVQKSEHQFQNVHVKDFDTTVEQMPAGGTKWTATPEHFAGSAWYDADPRSQQRIYYTDFVLLSEDKATPPYRQVVDVSWDGREGKVLALAGGYGKQMTRMRGVRLTNDLTYVPEFYSGKSRWFTGVGLTLQYWLTDEDQATPMSPRRSPATLLALEGKAKDESAEIVSQKMNGFDAIRLRLSFWSGSTTYWFDPTRGWALVRKQETVHYPSGETRTEEKDVYELKEVSPGIWFPMRGSVVDEDAPAGYRRYTYHVADVTVNDAKLDPAIFQPKIPTGWIVQDLRGPTQREFVTMEDGTELPVKVGQALPIINAGVAERPDGEGPPVTRDRNAAW